MKAAAGKDGFGGIDQAATGERLLLVAKGWAASGTWHSSHYVG